jgi:hypothetical protein
MFEGFAEQLHDGGIEAAHLAGELEADHAIADIPGGGGGVFQQRLAGKLDVAQQQHAGGADDIVIDAV